MRVVALQVDRLRFFVFSGLIQHLVLGLFFVRLDSVEFEVSNTQDYLRHHKSLKNSENTCTVTPTHLNCSDLKFTGTKIILTCLSSSLFNVKI